MEKKSIFHQYETQVYSKIGLEISTHQPTDIKIELSILRALSRLSFIKVLTAIIFDWGLIFLLAFLQLNYLSYYFYPIVLIIIATRQHALGIVLHDASHFRLLPNHFWNDLIADFLLAFPLNLTIFGYRREHFAHHKFSGMPNDPDLIRLSSPHYQKDKTTRYLILKMVLLSTGFYIVREFYEMGIKYQLSTKVPMKVNFSRIGFWAVMITIISLKHFWLSVLLFWFIPMSTVLMSIVFIRLKAEHDRIPNNKLLNTRTIIPTWIERFFISQHNVHFHLDHHLYPSVPFYQLNKLHQELLKNERYKKDAHISKGYFDEFWKEIISTESNGEEKKLFALRRILN